MLPIIATPKYDMVIPSTGETVKYRPYVVKEEKILLIALETQNEDAIETAVVDIIKACLESDINVDELTTFDIEFIFVTLRSKSVGEGIKVQPPCKHCEEVNEANVKLDEVKVANLDKEVDLHVKITDDISVDLKWHKIKDRLGIKDKQTETDTIINVVSTSIETIYSGEEIFIAKDVPLKEMIIFVESLNTDIFAEIIEILGEAPYLSYNLDFDCKKCGKPNEIELKGLLDFFQ